ncbi:hypothetical protein, partial [Pseudomonas carnis]|uniref:hypothetical protein n=2 Tax=Pseudomonas carnis TaxID=2487355 RepID=UPI0018E608BB
LKKEISTKNKIKIEDMKKIIEALDSEISATQNRLQMSKKLEAKFEQSFSSALHDLSSVSKLNATLINKGIHQASKSGRLKYSAKLINMALQKIASSQK